MRPSVFREVLRACAWLAALEASGATFAGLQEKPFAPRSVPAGTTLFTTLPAAATGIVTENRYDDPAMWRDRYQELVYGAIGTGVALGDYDGDGRPDLYIVSKTGESRLFRNLGGWKFSDVTAAAGLAESAGAKPRAWRQGATWTDVNNDGRLDLYVCRFAAPNLLYLNQGDGTFREEAAARGLALADACGMAAFCDYDRDGWLDVFLQTNLLDAVEHPDGQRNRLFRNRGDGTFVETTGAAGIAGEAQGHSATWWDYDADGWPDLYVANDFAAPDRLYRNNRNGTFTDVIGTAVPHMPYSAMGADLGDVDNDGRLDLFVGDMAATTHEADQRGMAELRATLKPASAALPQYARNALYLNTGTGRCLEAAFLTGLAATDWTWSLRFEDLDNDGRVDVHVTNGMIREVNNLDLLNRGLGSESNLEQIRSVQASPVLAQRNLAYRNRGDLRFERVEAAWGLDQLGVSFGAAFGDLDGDGDLDLVVANLEAGATVLRNDSTTGHRVEVELRGTRSNRFGIGATVRLESAAGPQVRQLVLARGYLSSSEPLLHFGLGDDARLARLTVTWPSGAVQTFADLPADRRFTITEPDAPGPTPGIAAPLPTQFTEAGAKLGFAFTSVAPSAAEVTPRLTPWRFNGRDQALAVADVDGDGREEIIVGESREVRVLRRDAQNRFSATPVLHDRPDDGPLLAFDANGDGAPDLLITRGGAALPEGAPEYQPGLYLNDGHGRFTAAPGALPPFPASIGAAVAADFDRDGRPDVFLGARLAPERYPQAPESALLANRGGRFEDVTDRLAPGLREVGLVTAALWSDADGDGWPDLFVACEWGNVRYFHNDAGRGFTDWTERAGFAAAGTGWWTALASADFNGDGRPDYVAGNTGLNTQYHASPDAPALLFSGDFKDSGTPLPVEAYFEHGQLYPRRARRDLAVAAPSLRKRFPQNNDYARAPLAELVGESRLAGAERYAATELRSGVFLSQPDGTWRFAPLPRLAQIAPLSGLVTGDFDGDGHADVYAVQNSHAPIDAIGRFDGGLSQLLRGDGRGNFSPVPPAASGLVVPGAAQAVVAIDLNGDGRPDFLVTRQGDTALAFLNQGAAQAR